MGQCRWRPIFYQCSSVESLGSDYIRSPIDSFPTCCVITPQNAALLWSSTSRRAYEMFSWGFVNKIPTFLTDFEVCAHKTREDAKMTSIFTFRPLSCSQLVFIFSVLVFGIILSSFRPFWHPVWDPGLPRKASLKAFDFGFFLNSFEVLHNLVYLKFAQLRNSV